MDYTKTEKKWQERWKNTGLHTFDEKNPGEKFYMLEMFSYPSGANLHLGHWYNFGLSDTYARYKKMNGYNVFQPMGFDAFGLPAENYAIKTGIHPKDSTYKNIAKMEGQLRAMGAMFDWSKTLRTSDEEYYKWTQWLFLQLYKHGLAYQKDSAVNFCTGCQTVIANEQVIDGECERCGSPVARKSMLQWFFKITAYAEELLDTVDALDWPEKSKIMQKNWIGRSTGGEIEFDAGGYPFRVFTTRADTVFGVSYVVLAPEHPLVSVITTPACKQQVEQYCADAARATEIDRLCTTKEKTGVFTGAYAVNPANNKRVPVWIADYVLGSYGTGAVMGVPAHDARDFEFAKKYDLPILRVIDGGPADAAYTEPGVMINSGPFDGAESEAGKAAVLEYLEKLGKGKNTVNYRLRDWSVSRQRYWGCPIPIVHCERCGAVPVPESDLPVTLPYDVNFTPDGQSPLKKHAGYMNVKCPRCGAAALRDPDTLDTFVCSSWYFLRYPDARNVEAAFDKGVVNRMLPVDKYVGGAEHVCMHLLYARFFVKTLRDMGLLGFSEPFKSLVHQGMILGPDGAKMSKNRGNIVNPDKYTLEYGSDTLRLYLAFGFNYTEGGPWSDDGVKAIVRFLDRVERAAQMTNDGSQMTDKGHNEPNLSFVHSPLERGGGEAEGVWRHLSSEKELDYAVNYAIKAVSVDTENFSFNTAVARCMELLNAINKYDADNSARLTPHASLCRNNAVRALVKLLAPYAPHFCEELNERMGGKASLFAAPCWPVCDESKLARDEVELAVQINSKLKSKITVSASATDAEITAAALADPRVVDALAGQSPKKVIVVKGRLVNIIA